MACASALRAIAENITSGRSPLQNHYLIWNGKQFALEMEQAYQQMWSNYINNSL
ncbi:hypothetical protein [Myxosarcina sp. GI1]|uniref:hypothetical protein n=1 Tax=Myxosarcina sp. GI1 TaxID=1541065 RepID=UPI001C10CC5C|nr:hypothetical protein [Myxosarcina sp. GI1]